VFQYDAIIIGSGFGGAMAASRLVDAGWRVLVLERGEHVPRGPDRRDPRASLALTPYYSFESGYRSPAGGSGAGVGGVFCVGGQSVFFGGVAFRLRVEDFVPKLDIVRGSGARWPFGYEELEPHYGQAERLLDVAGEESADIAEPPRSTPFPATPAPLADASQRFAAASRTLGLTPVQLPLAINYRDNGRPPCDGCRLCDSYACAIQAKNDTDVAVLQRLSGRGLDVRAGVVVTRLAVTGRRVSEVHGWDKERDEPVKFSARHVILAAGALASPHLLLASRLERLNPAGHAVGRHLIRHCCAFVLGFCNFLTDPGRVFHKQLAILDYYLGDPGVHGARATPLGSIQQICPPPAPLMKAHMSRFWKKVDLAGFVEHLTGALVIAEDEPQKENRVSIDPADVDRFGLPRLHIFHRYSPRDEERRRLLVARTKSIQKRVGAWSFYTHEVTTFSHAMGTVRMGRDAAADPLDEYCRFRGIDNLIVVDASAMPTGGALNPSLTIAANALRAADHLATRES
jgi:choline dehydrogenase-like flavoprotein